MIGRFVSKTFQLLCEYGFGGLAVCMMIALLDPDEHWAPLEAVFIYATMVIAGSLWWRCRFNWRT